MEDGIHKHNASKSVQESITTEMIPQGLFKQNKLAIIEVSNDNVAGVTSALEVVDLKTQNVRCLSQGKLRKDVVLMKVFLFVVGGVILESKPANVLVTGNSNV